MPDDFVLGHAMLRYLATHPNASTDEVSASCDIDSLLSVARKLNGCLHEQNLFISCLRSPDSDSAGTFQWGIYRTVVDTETKG